MIIMASAQEFGMVELFSQIALTLVKIIGGELKVYGEIKIQNRIIQNGIATRNVSKQGRLTIIEIDQ